MFRPCHYLKIFWSIVRLHPIQMMGGFVVTQWSSNFILGGNNMFINVTPSISSRMVFCQNKDVPMRGSLAATFPIRFKRSCQLCRIVGIFCPAFHRTPQAGPTLARHYWLPTDRAGNLHLDSSPSTFSIEYCSLPLYVPTLTPILTGS